MRTVREDGRATSRLLRQMRLHRAASMSQRQAAAFMGVSQATVSRLESGITKPTLAHLHVYARAVGLRLTVEAVDR